MSLLSKLTIAVCLLLCCSLCYGNDSLPISHLTIQNGLSNNSVRCVYQDKKGFMWFGTYDGLNRYDGSEFKVFRNRLSDSTSIPHNYIYSLHEDIQHNLWVGTGQGLAVYNNTSAKFAPSYFYPYQSAQQQKISFNTNSINSDDKGNIFIGTNGWGFMFKKANEKIARQICLQTGTQISTGYNVRSIVIIDKKVWLFILDMGLYQFDINTEKIIPVNTEIKVANCMQPDKEGNIWIGNDKGLFKYVVASNTYAEQYEAAPGKLNAAQVTSLCFDQHGNLWIGTDGGGINILDKSTRSFKYILPGESKDKLSSESVYSIIADKESRMWVGTIKGGCNIIDEQQSRFRTVAYNPFSKNTLASNFIYSFCEDAAKNLLVGTDGGGLSIWNRKTNSFTNYKHVNGIPNSLSHNSVTSIKQDYKGDIWIATFGGGVSKLNKETGTFEFYKCINDSTGNENVNIWILYEDKEKTLWATTFSNGKLYKLNRNLNKFEVFSQQLNNLVAITEDNDGNLWAGNATQLIKIDKLNRQHSYYEIGKPVRALYQDKKQNFWIGSEGGGLILFDSKNGKIVQRFSDADGLCNNAVLNIKEDREGNLWLSTFNGLSKFDPLKKVFKNFYQSDGLQSNQFSYNAALQLTSGEIVFGGINGFNIFSPENIAVRNYMPSLFVTGILVNNKPIAELNEFITKADYAQIQELEIPYDQAVLSFRFNALEYSSPEKILYAYYLQGWDKDWNYTGNVKNINYNNLQEGKYTLRLKNTNANGEWNTHETILKLTILPPWYRTWWAYLIYLVAAASVIYAFYRYRTQQAKLRYKVKLAQLTAEKEKELNENRQAFFTNITHEFRTPLTLIINPVKDILQKENGEAEKTELSFVYRNARRLLSLVDQLLLFRKTESDTGILQVATFNFYQLCHDSFLYFTQQAKAKHINYVFDCDNTTLQICGDKEKLEIIFYNLLSNAFKYTPEKGTVIFRITETPETIEAAIIDNGQGIPPQTGDKLFEKYYRVNEKDAPVKPGFGIGLYLVKQFIDKHKGQISYTSNKETGTSFNISLHKGSQHFGAIANTVNEMGNANVLQEIAAGNEGTEEIQNGETDGLESIVSEKPSILITDDNVQMRNYLAQVFQQNFIVYEAANGNEGLKIAKEFQPDIIISDVVMQDTTGIDFCKAVKESPALNHIPFILLTGSFSPESKLKGIEYGADDYITKPFEKDMLVARVQSLLRKQQNLQKYFYDEITHRKNTLNISGEYKGFLENCIAIVEQHLDDDNFNIQVLAREIGMSHSSLYKKIKTISGQSANAFIRYIRLRKAAEMFINTNHNINETAFYIGIKDIKYFREQFTKTFGMKPSEYIEKYRKSMGKNYKLNEKLIKDTDEKLK
jgi:ligand-binding sensor domain-containing protein/signal transduction histidine kinase/DNA-binding response OmpR family regulator